MKQSDPDTRQVVVTSAAEIQPRAMRFLHRPWLPLGEFSLLAGEPGLGKSSLLAHYAAAATKGRLDGDLAGQPVNVLIAGTEESEEATVVPRLEASGADLLRVHLLSAQEHGRATALTLPDDLSQLEEHLRTTKARFVTFDPLSAFLTGKVNTWREHDVRRVLAAVTEIARKADASILGVAHLNKSDAAKLMERVGGSVGFAAAARSVIAFGRDPSDPEGPRGSQRIIAHAKCNVAPEANPLSALITPTPIWLEDKTSLIPRLEITGQATVEADDLLSSREDWSARDDAADFLRNELADGPVPAKELHRRAEAAGHASSTLRRAKSALGIRSKKQADGTWQWQLPHNALNPDEHLEHLEHLQTTKGSKVAKLSNLSSDPSRGEPNPDEELKRIQQKFPDLNADKHSQPDLNPKEA